MANSDIRAVETNNRKSATERRVATVDLQIGMYVSRLDRPWIDTDFVFQGFLLADPHEVEELRRDCEYVYIDIASGKEAKHYLSPEDEELKSICDVPKRDNVYKDTVLVEEELETAREVHAEAEEVLANMMDDVQAEKRIQLSGVFKLVGNMLGSILRNPDALMWLTKLKKKDSYTYSHCIDASTFAMAFGRHLGLPQEDILNLGMGALLFDIGKMKLPNDLLIKPGRLTQEEYFVIRKHVQHSVDIVKQIQEINPDVVSMVHTHHERYDGNGYPRRLKGNEIPLFGRMAAIVDCYDAVTSSRPYRRAMSPPEALRIIYKQRNRAFQDELVEQFIQCLGVYPTGTLVELSTGEVGIIVSQNRVRRLRPTVMLILNKDKIAYEQFKTIDMADVLSDARGRPLEIARSLQPGTHGIDPKEYYL